MAGYVQSKEAAISDAMWAIHITDSLLVEGNVELSEFKPLLTALGNYGISAIDDRRMPYFPVGNSLIAMPIVWVRAQFDQRFESLHDHLIDSLPSDPIVSEYQIFAASVVIALSALVLANIARRQLDWWRVLPLIFLYAFGTSVFSTGTRGLWSHGPSVLMLMLVLWTWEKADENHNWLAATGIFIALAYIIRPTNSIAVLVWSLYALWRFRWQAWRFFTPAMLIAGGFITFSWFNYNVWLPPYYAAGRLTPIYFWEALLGNLISPGRGLFIYSPILLFALGGVWLKLKQATWTALDTALITICTLHWIVISAFGVWWGGASYGPRFFTDMIPYLCYFLIPVIKQLAFTTRLQKSITLLFALFAIASSIIHYRGAYESFVFDWGSTPASLNTHLHRLWDWSDVSFLRRKADQPLFTIPREYVLTEAMFATETFPDFTIGNWEDDGSYYWRAFLPPSLHGIETAQVRYHVDNAGHRWLESKEPLPPSGAHWLRFDYAQQPPPFGSLGAIAFEVFSAETDQLIDQFVVPISYASPNPTRFTQIGNIIVLPDDVQITDQGDELSNLYALFGSGWYAAESFEAFRWRWAQSPANLFVYSGQACRATLTGHIGPLYEPDAVDGKGESGELTVRLHDETQTIAIQNNQPFAFQMPLKSGWNQLVWSLEAGNFRPIDLDPANSDRRTLSFALSSLQIQGCSR